MSVVGREEPVVLFESERLDESERQINSLSLFQIVTRVAAVATTSEFALFMQHTAAQVVSTGAIESSLEEQCLSSHAALEC